MKLNYYLILPALFTLAFISTTLAHQDTKINKIGVQTGTAAECAFTDGFNLAHSKNIYRNNCPENQEHEFLVGYRIGRKLAWVESAIAIEDQPKELEALKEKQKKIIALKNDIEKSPINSPTLIKSYLTTGPVDDLDVDLNWKSYITKSGGLQNLDESTKNLIYTEIPDTPNFPEPIRNGGIIGFGVGHKRQGRPTEALKYQIVDTILVASLIAGLTNQNHSVFNEVLGLIGIPLSRSFQLLDLYTYNQENNFNIENLRTKNEIRPPQFLVYNYTW
jgi:hypothetical protein